MSFEQPWTAGSNKDYSDNKRYSVGTQVLFSWTEDVNDSELVLWQDNHPGDAEGGPSVVVDDSVSGSTYSWTVSYEGLDASYNNVFYFTLDEGNDSFSSHYFNISAKASSTTTTATTSTTTSTTSTSSVSSQTQTQTDDHSPDNTGGPNSGGGLSPGEVAGVAIGGVVVACLLIASLVWWRRRRRRDQMSKKEGEGTAAEDAWVAQYMATRAAKEGHHEIGGGQIFEAADVQDPPRIHEADGDPVRREIAD